jgi:ribosomal protein S4
MKPQQHDRTTARSHDSKKRLDAVLVERGLAENRKQAAALILSGVVLVDEQRVDKPGILIDSASEIRTKGTERPYVSRAGFKLGQSGRMSPEQASNSKRPYGNSPFRSRERFVLIWVLQPVALRTVCSNKGLKKSMPLT